MIVSSKYAETPYRPMGDVILLSLGDDQSLRSLAELLDVSCVTLHKWATGKCRPRAWRLGHLCAILKFTDDEVVRLAELAGYDGDQLDEALEAFAAWPQNYERWQMARDAQRKVTKKVLDLLESDADFRTMFEDKAPRTYTLAEKALKLNEEVDSM